MLKCFWRTCTISNDIQTANTVSAHTLVLFFYYYYYFQKENTFEYKIGLNLRLSPTSLSIENQTKRWKANMGNCAISRLTSQEHLRDNNSINTLASRNQEKSSALLKSSEKAMIINLVKFNETRKGIWLDQIITIIQLEMNWNNKRSPLLLQYGRKNILW